MPDGLMPRRGGAHRVWRLLVVLPTAKIWLAGLLADIGRLLDRMSARRPATWWRLPRSRCRFRSRRPFVESCRLLIDPVSKLASTCADLPSTSAGKPALVTAVPTGGVPRRGGR